MTAHETSYITIREATCVSTLENSHETSDGHETCHEAVNVTNHESTNETTSYRSLTM